MDPTTSTNATTSTTPTTSTNHPPCPYLDTINRPLLDFDFEPSCSLTLESSPHIYACLVCGKFFRGKGRHTPAYTHSVETAQQHSDGGTGGGHFVYLHLTKGTYHCLPEDYQLRNPSDLNSLRDISMALHPQFTRAQVEQLDDNRELARDLLGRRYLPGFVGLNNLKRTDYLNVVVQALGHVGPLRDYFLLCANETNGTSNHANNTNNTDNANHFNLIPYESFSPLAKTFSLLLRNMWSPHRFKANIDPHMLVQAVSVASHKRYHVGEQAKQVEAGEFLAWLLNMLHVGVGGKVGKVGKEKRKKKKRKIEKQGTNGETGKAEERERRSIIHETFMGTVEVTTLTRRKRRRGEAAALQMLAQGGSTSDAQPGVDDDNNLDDDDDRAGSDDETTHAQKQTRRQTLQTLADELIIVEEERVQTTEFLQLTLDIPEKPLFKDEDGGLVIPQEPLVNVLRKFDGVSFCEVPVSGTSGKSSADGTGSTADEGIVLSQRRRYRLKRLPNYLILHLSRFKKNNFSVEKNPTIVMFPVKNFDLSEYVFPEEDEEKNGKGKEKVPTEEEVRLMSTKQLLQFFNKYGRPDLAANTIEKSTLLQTALNFLPTLSSNSSLSHILTNKYDLVANITHDSPPEVGKEGQRNPLEEGSYKCHVQHTATGQWYEMDDLEVRETMPQLIGVSESYILIFGRKGAYGRGG